MSFIFTSKHTIKQPYEPKESNNKFVRQLAKTILRAMTIKEESFNHEAAKLETESINRRGEFYVDYQEFYELNDLQSIQLACKETELPEEFAYPIYLSFRWGNDVAEWAKDMLGKEE